MRRPRYGIEKPEVSTNLGLVIGVGIPDDGGTGFIDFLRVWRPPVHATTVFVLAQPHDRLLCQLEAWSQHCQVPLIAAEKDVSLRVDHAYLISSSLSPQIDSGWLRCGTPLNPDEGNSSNHLDRFFDSVGKFSGVFGIGILIQERSSEVGSRTDGARGLERVALAGGMAFEVVADGFLGEREQACVPAESAAVVERMVATQLVHELRKHLRFWNGDRMSAGGAVEMAERVHDVVAFQDRASRLDLALEAGRMGLWEWNIANDVLSWSPQLHDLFGHRKDQFQANREGFLSIVHPEDRQRIAVLLESILSSDCPRHEVEFRVIRGDDGGIVWVHSRGMIQRDAAGQPLGFVSVAVDFTARKIRELNLEFLSSLQQTISEFSAPEAIAIVASQRISEYMQLSHLLLIDVDSVAERAQVIHDSMREGQRDLRGLYDLRAFASDEERAQLSTNRPMVVNDTCDANRSPESRANFSALDIAAIVNAPATRDNQLTFMLSAVKSKPHVWLEGEVQLLREVSSLIRLKLDRARALQSMRQSQARLRLGMEVAKFALAEIDFPNESIQLSDEAWQLLGHQDAAKLVGLEHWLDDFHAEDSARMREQLDRLQHDPNVPEFSQEFRVILPNGKTRWLDIAMRAFLDPSQANAYVTHALLAMQDITDDKQRALELADREAHLRRVINNQLGLVGVIDPDGSLLEIDDRSVAIAGVNRSDVIGRHFSECVWWTYDNAISERMRESMQRSLAGEVVRYDVEIYAKGDQRLIIDFMLVPVQDDAGQVLYLIPSGVDISARKAAETELAESEQRLMLVLRSARMGFFSWDLKSDDVCGDGQHQVITGLHVERFKSQEFLDRIHREDADSNRDAIEKSIQGGDDYEHEFRFLRGDGQLRWLAGRGRVLAGPDGSPQRFIGLNWDVTDSKLQEQRMRESEERLRNAAEASGFGTVHADLLHDSVHYSQEFLRMLALPCDALLPTSLHSLPTWIYEEDRNDCEQFYRSLPLLAEGTTQTIDHRIVRADGQIRWVRLQGKPIYTGQPPNRKVTQLIGTVLDITPQREFEQSLENARCEAEAASRSKSEFLANMSHEIRTPMTAVLGYTDLLLTRPQEPESVEFLQTIKRNGNFLLEIINDILDLSKIEAGKLEVMNERFSPHQLVEDIRSLMNVRASEKNLQFYVTYDGHIPEWIESDPKRLKQILVNLVGNAIKFTEFGQVQLIMRFVRDPTPMLAFEVRDTGIGMTPEQQEQLFQPFSQGDPSVTRRYGGSGLGLTISQRLAQILGGAITCVSRLDQGSQFTCMIAVGTDVVLVDQASMDSPSQPMSLPVTLDPLDCRVLVVDDRRDVRHLTRHILMKAGAHVELAEDGQQALEYFERMQRGYVRPVDIILLDMQMPIIDGYQAAAELRKRGFQHSIIALTADAMQGDMNRCLESGCNGYLSKPIDSARLVQTVREYTRTGSGDDNP